LEVPPLESQLQFANTVEIVERARASSEAQVRAAEALTSRCLQHIFDGAASSCWPTCALADISEIVGGIQKSPDRTPTNLHRPYLTVRNVQRGYLDFSRVERFEVTADEIRRLRLVPADLLIVEGNGSL